MPRHRSSPKARRLTPSYSRRAALLKYGPLYKIFSDAEYGRCYYCGMPADTYDHCPPLKWVFVMGADIFRETKVPLLKVPSCRECNTLLGECKLFTPYDRLKRAKDRLEFKYKKFMRGSVWTLDDLEELGRVMRSYVRNHADLQVMIEHRLAWPDGVIR